MEISFVDCTSSRARISGRSNARNGTSFITRTGFCLIYQNWNDITGKVSQAPDFIYFEISDISYRKDLRCSPHSQLLALLVITYNPFHTCSKTNLISALPEFVIGIND